MTVAEAGDPSVPVGPWQGPSPEALASAARHLLGLDGRAFALQPWQAGYLVALAEGREPLVPPGCGVGKGWLDARLREALAEAQG